MPKKQTKKLNDGKNLIDSEETTGLKGDAISGLTNYSQWPMFSEPAVNWQGAEGDTIGDSAMTISSKKIQFKTMAIPVKISKRLIRDADTIQDKK